MISRGSKGSPGGRPFAQNRGVGPLEPFPSLLRPLAFPLAFPWTPPLFPVALNGPQGTLKGSRRPGWRALKHSP